MLNYRKLIYLIPLLLFCVPSARANQNAQGWCEVGATPVVTSGLVSTTQVQASYPACTVTVFVHGGGLATIFSDNNATPLANPFTASTNGLWQFYAANGRYDIQLSGAGFVAPVTLSDISLSDPANQQAALPNTNLAFSPTPSFNATNNVSYTMTLTGNVTASTITGTPANGNLLSLTLIEDAIGGRSFVFPTNFNLPLGFSFNTVALATNALTFKFDGTNWNLISNSGTGNGSNAQGLVGTVQTTNGTGALATSGEKDNGTIFSIDRNTGIFGPNPYNDVTRYGGSFSTSTTTAGCINGSPNITLAAALDFLDAISFPAAGIGNGIVIYQCGVATGLTTPSAPTVTPSGVTGGGTTYNYKIVPEDLSGGLPAASAQGQTTTGASALGVTTVNLTAAAWVNTLNGQNTYTCSGNCNTQDGTLIRIDGFTNTNFDGNYTIVSHPDATHFVTASPRAPTISSESASATVKLLACNVLTLPASSVAAIETGGDTVLRYWVYRNNALATVIQGHDPYYEDCGMNIASAPSYVPTTPGSAVNKYLATTIVSGAGTVNLVVANAAGNTISGQTALHDSSRNLLAATNASHFSTPVYVPAGLTFNAATVFTNTNAGNTEILLPCGPQVNQPWVIKANGIKFTGGKCVGSNSFGFDNTVNFVGAGNGSFPVVYVQPSTLNNTGSGVQFENITFAGSQLGQIAFMVQYDAGSLFGLQMRRVSFGNSNSASNVNTPAAWISSITESIIGQVGDRNSCATAQNILGPPCMRFTTVSRATYSGNVGLAGIVQINGFAVLGGSPSFQVDALPYTNSGGPIGNVIGITSLRFVDGLREIGKGAYLRVGSALTGNFYFRGLDDDAPNAAPGNGWVDNTNGATVSYFDAEQLGGSVTNQVLVAGPGNFRCGPNVLHACISSSSTGAGGAAGAVSNSNVASSGTATVGYLMSRPAAPSVVVGGSGSCVSNCVAAGTYSYGITAIDVGGFESAFSLTTSGTTDGTQTITVSWTPIAGQVATRRFRNGVSDTNPGTGIGGTSFVDAGNIFYSNSTLNLGGTSSSLSSAGVSTPTLILTGGGFKSTSSGTFTANRTVTEPDISYIRAGTNIAQTFTAAQTFSVPITVPSGGTGVSTFTTNGLLYGNGASAVQVTAASGSGTFCAVSTNGGVPTWGSCAGSAATAWSSLTNPSGNLSLSMGTNTSLFTSGVLTGTSSPWSFTDGNSTSTGNLLSLFTGASSTLHPFAATAQGSANGVQMSTAGVLAPIGTGGITANAFSGQVPVANGGTGASTLSANLLLYGNGTSPVGSLTGSLIGTNPVLTLTPATASATALALNTAVSPTGDILDLQINGTKTAWFDSAAFLHTPGTTYTGSGILSLSSTAGSCPAPAAGVYFICIADSASQTIQTSLNNQAYKPLPQWTNTAPSAHGVVLVGATFPQQNFTSAGVAGQSLVSGGPSADPSFGNVNVAGGGTGLGTLTAHAVILGEGTSAVAFAGPDATSNQPLLSAGASADPTFGALPLGNSNAVSGILPIANGGTGAATLAGASIVTVTGVITANNCVKWSSSTVATDAGAPCGGSGGASRLDQITAATAANTIASSAFQQAWQWHFTGSQTGMLFQESTASTGTGNILARFNTLSTSTAAAFQADNNGNGVLLNSSGLLTKVGTGAIDATALSGVGPCASEPALTGDVTTPSGSCATTIAANAVTAAKSAVVLTRRTCTIVIGADNGAALVNADLAPQLEQCQIPYAATVVEIDVRADGGTPSVVVAKRHCTASACTVGANETVSDLTSSALAAGTAGAAACSNTGGTTGFDGFTTCSSTLQNTSLAIGDYIETHTATAGGTAKRMSIFVHYTVN